MNLLELKTQKLANQKLTMVTCYDFWSARLLNETPIDMILVGDSAAMVMHGFEDTLPATVELMRVHVQAVRRGASGKFIIADLPFLSYHGSLQANIENIKSLMQAGAHGVKLEGYNESIGELISHLSRSGIPVMGHIGLTPQSLHALGGFRVQGRDADQGQRLISDARGLEAAGCFAVVLECVPGDLAAEISKSISIPTIGIGAGRDCDGQVLVLHDLLGLNPGFRPKFLRQYLNGAELIQNAVQTYCGDVRTGKFPSQEETYK